MLKQIAGLVLITRPLIVISILFTPAATAFLAADGIPPVVPSILAAMLIVAATAGAHTFNDYCDMDLDALNLRTAGRPLVKNILPRWGALLFSLLLMALSLLFGLLINRICFLFTLGGIALILIYSLKLKRTRAGFFLPAFAAFLLPLGAWAVYKPGEIFSTVPVMIGIIGFCFELEPYWCQTILDVEGDRIRDARTIPVYFGIAATSRIMMIMFSIAYLLLILLFSIADLWYLYLMTVALPGAALLVMYIDFARKASATMARWLFASTMMYLTLFCLAIMVEKTFQSVHELLLRLEIL